MTGSADCTSTDYFGKSIATTYLASSGETGSGRVQSQSRFKAGTAGWESEGNVGASDTGMLWSLARRAHEGLEFDTSSVNGFEKLARYRANRKASC